jgi:hypothetical protein
MIIAFTATASMLVGCQDGVKYVVYNGCSDAFEVWTVDTPNVEPEDTAVDWEVVQPGLWVYSSTGPDLDVLGRTM